MEEIKTPQMGDTVFYVLKNNQVRAATVVQSWPHTDRCNLTVHLDQCSDVISMTRFKDASGSETIIVLDLPRVPLGVMPVGSMDMRNGTLAVSSAKYDPINFEPGTWHYRIDAQGVLA